MIFRHVMGICGAGLMTGALVGCSADTESKPHPATESYRIACDGTAVSENAALGGDDGAGDATPIHRCQETSGLGVQCAAPTTEPVVADQCRADDARLSQRPFPEGSAPLCVGTTVFVWTGSDCVPYNTIDGLPYRRPDPARTAEHIRFLHRHGILAKTRQSAGQDIDGGCGQLRAREVAVRRMRRDAPGPVPPVAL